MAKLTITVDEAAAKLGIGRSAAYEAVRRGEIPHLRFGRRIQIPVARLAELLGVDPASMTSDSNGGGL
jgi:excisionase family DNA binding protein